MKEKTELQADSFEFFYKDYYPKLATFASLFLKSDDAHDVVQDVFLSLLETDFLRKSNLKAYLYQAVRNKCVDHIRHKIVESQYTTNLGQKLFNRESEYFYSSHNEIEAALFSKELQEKIDSIVEELPPKGREIFKLFFYQNKPAKEISILLNISNSTVENHIYNCVKAVRSKVAKHLLSLVICFLSFLK